ncbi:hypothetical protein LUZ61_018178 [Rhynchospora tenuis]|uniref:HORMA domain-containing protein n=1 Tax=Rhynchospora tenuis TaxID=198213 RepID=A0AAD6ELQ3_9POAL|nr:hypothetical protein LUZ61_018178 [Rhynchospora tenuis]
MDRKNQSPQGQTAKVVVEFLEVAINCIVFLKGFYPSRAFERRRYMNVVVNKARHPQLANYIHSSIFALLPYIQKGLVERVVVIFYGQDQVPLEKFVFKLTIDQSYQSSVSEAELEFALRAFLVKLNAAGPIAKPLPSGANWEITAYFRELPSQENEGEQAKLWVPTDTKQWMQPSEITPIKSMDSNPLKVQLYMEHPTVTEQKV